MNKFEKLIELNKEFDGMLVEDKTNCIWFENDWVISWSEDNCRTSLMNGDGYSYSTDIHAMVTQDDDYVLFFLDGDFGSYYLALFSKNNKVAF